MTTRTAAPQRNYVRVPTDSEHVANERFFVVPGAWERPITDDSTVHTFGKTTSLAAPVYANAIDRLWNKCSLLTATPAVILVAEQKVVSISRAWAALCD